MSNNQSENTNNPVSKIELAAWAVVSEALDGAAVERIKEQAKSLTSESASDVQKKTLASKSLPTQRKTPSRMFSWLIRGGVAAAIAGIVFATVLVPSDKATAFAAALKKLDLVKAFSYDHIVHSENLPTPAHVRVTVCEDGRSRHEIGGTVSVRDATSMSRLTLIVDTKTAIVSPAVEGMEKFDQLNVLKELRNLDNESTEDLGEKEIDGVVAVGKKVTVSKSRFHIWFDAKAEELVLVEIFQSDDSPIEKSVFKNFNFNAEADDSLFSFEVPEGYTVYEPSSDLMRFISDPEQNVIELMQDHADLADGKFPRSLSDWGDWTEILSAGGNVNEKLAEKLGALMSFLTELRKENHAYLGDGVSLKQEERVIVFWYKNKEGQFRAIYSDLTVNDIQETDVPK